MESLDYSILDSTPPQPVFSTIENNVQFRASSFIELLLSRFLSLFWSLFRRGSSSSVVAWFFELHLLFVEICLRFVVSILASFVTVLHSFVSVLSSSFCRALALFYRASSPFWQDLFSFCRALASFCRASSPFCRLRFVEFCLHFVELRLRFSTFVPSSFAFMFSSVSPLLICV